MHSTILEMKKALGELEEEYIELRLACNEELDVYNKKQLLILLELNMGDISKLERDIQYFEGLYVNH